MDTFYYQEEHAVKGEFRPKAALLASLIVGPIFLLVTHGIHWNSSGALDSVMGRMTGADMLTNTFFHLLLSVIYGFVVGLVTYKFYPLAAILWGGAIGGALYLSNFLIFHVVLGIKGNEPAIFLTHIVFGLAFAAAYKALSLPRMGREEKEAS